MLIPMDRPLIDARNIREAATQTVGNGFTLEHNNRRVLLVSSDDPRTSDGTTAIVDGIRIGQLLRIIHVVIEAQVTVQDNANTKLQGDWSAINAENWLDVVWDGSDWIETDRSFGIVNMSGLEAHAEGGTTTASGRASHAEGSITTASGDYSHAEGSRTEASGNYSHAEGIWSTASSSYSHAMGNRSKASLESQFAQAGGRRVADGDAQFTRFIMRKTTTTDAATQEVTSPSRFTLDDDKVYACRINITAIRLDVFEAGWWNRMVLVTRDAGGADVTIVAQHTIEDMGSNGGNPPPGWGISFDEDDANDSLKIMVQTGANVTVHWVVNIEAVEVA